MTSSIGNERGGNERGGNGGGARNGRGVVIVGAVRTPIGKFGGILSRLSAVDLAVAAIRSALERAALDPSAVDECVLGHARQAGCGPNPARQAACRAEIPEDAPAWTVNQACNSGLRALISAAQIIALGEADVVVAGGTESMSNTPYLLRAGRWGLRLGDTTLEDGMYRDGFRCPLAGELMGETAETLAVRFAISRAAQDAYAAESQRRCEAARREGRFTDEIVPVAAPGDKGTMITVERDEHPRDGVSLERLAALPPAFRPDGTVTAGNSSGIADGAAALVLMAEEKARKRSLPPLARVSGWAVAGVDPRFMGLGPIPAVRLLQQRTGIDPAAIDLVELNEAFAVQVLACLRELPFDPARLNVNGGSIPLGHPIGASGSRLVVTLLHEMRRREAKTGLATLCVSGGMGGALLLERMT